MSHSRSLGGVRDPKRRRITVLPEVHSSLSLDPKILANGRWVAYESEDSEEVVDVYLARVPKG